MSAKHTAERTIQTVAVLGSLVLVNILGLQYFGRIDLTREGQFTLSSATIATLDTLTDPVTVRAYFTSDMPPPFNTHARYVRDLLEEYYNHGDGYFRYEFIDPAAEETAEDKEKKKEVRQDIFGRRIREPTSVERELQSLGIQPVQVQVNEGDKVETKRAYMGIAISYGGEREAIPVVQSTAGLEYDLTTLIRKLADRGGRRVALLEGYGGPDPQQEIGRALGLLGQLHDVTPLDLPNTDEIPADVDAVLLVGPRQSVPEEDRKKIDAYLARGGSAAFLLDAIDPDLQTLEVEPIDHGLDELLEAYGVSIEPGLVLDAQCSSINVATQQGFMRIQQSVRYPFFPQPERLDPDHPLTGGLTQVVFPFMSPLRVDGTGDAQAEVLVKSSAESWVQKPPYDLNPMQRWTATGDRGERSLMVALEGKLPSPFGSEADGEREPARLLVAGGASFVLDQFLAQGNEALLLNATDWLVRDDALLAVRTRGLTAAPLEDLSDSTRSAIRYANVLGVPLLCVVIGLVRWRLRERRRSRVHL